MSEVGVCADGKGDKILVTHGVSTCIAIMLHGAYDGIPFILMDHWDGEIIDNKKEFIRYKICDYIAQIQNAIIHDYDPDIHDDISVFIKKVVVIGGEKRQFDQFGNTEVSGTEVSVELLRENLVAEIEYHCTFVKGATQFWQNYLTSGSQSMTVQIDITGAFQYYEEATPLIESNEAVLESKRTLSP